MKLRKERHAIAGVANEAGATASFQVTGNKHIKVTLTYQGRSQFVVISGTPGKTYAINEMIADVRRTLRELGYVEPVKAPKAKERTYRRRQTPPVQRKPGEARPLPRYRHRWNERNAMVPVLRELRARLAA